MKVSGSETANLPPATQAPQAAPSPNTSAQANQMWGGRFAGGPDLLMQKINASIGFDQKLWRQDIRGSQAHCQMLVQQKIISAEDGAQILNGLEQIYHEIEAGKFQFKVELEDIHMNVEARLAELIGPVAGRLHTARSRNDQVATDFKLWVRDAIDDLVRDLGDLAGNMLSQAEQHCDTILPGFTHLQAAQPVTLGHHLLAYVEMLARDRSRLLDCRKRLNECPLGSAALAGTSFPLDREMVARNLGFDRPTANSLDAVADRDFAMEFLSDLSILSVHLSRLAEELVVFSSAQFGFIRMGDSFSTGSSIMPQKRNPDAAELVRAKSGRVIGDLNNLLILMKGLPLAYSKDMQEDKPAVFDAYEQIHICVHAMAGMIQTMEVNKARMAQSANLGFITATDLADWLVQALNIPFRQAHHITGALVKVAEDQNIGLEDLSLTDMQKIEPKINETLFERLGVENSVKSRTSYGGTAPDNVRAQIERHRQLLANEKSAGD